MNEKIPNIEIAGVKICSNCKVEKSIYFFGKHSREKDGFRKVCKDCRKFSSKQYYENNKERIIKYQKNYSNNNLDKIKLKRKSYYAKNKDKIKKLASIWSEQNKCKRAKYSKKYYEKNKGYYFAHSAKRRKMCKKQTIKMSHDQWNEIVKIYKLAKKISVETGILHHVDHIIPLAGKNCSGLHVPWNLQIIPAIDNLKKGNKVQL